MREQLKYAMELLDEVVTQLDAFDIQAGGVLPQSLFDRLATTSSALEVVYLNMDDPDNERLQELDFNDDSSEVPVEDED